KNRYRRLYFCRSCVFRRMNYQPSLIKHEPYGETISSFHGRVYSLPNSSTPFLYRHTGILQFSRVASYDRMTKKELFAEEALIVWERHRHRLQTGKRDV